MPWARRSCRLGTMSNSSLPGRHCGGVLQNDEATAKGAFERHPDMVLRLTDTSCFIANWGDKPQKACAGTLLFRFHRGRRAAALKNVAARALDATGRQTR